MAEKWIEKVAGEIRSYLRNLDFHDDFSEEKVADLIAEAHAECEVMKIIKRNFEIWDRLDVLNAEDIPDNMECDKLRRERAELRITARKLVGQEDKGGTDGEG